MKNILTLLLVFFGLSASATHLVGGNMTYTYLGDTDGDGNYNYKITFQTFLDCNSQNWLTGFPNQFPEQTLDVGIYEGGASPSGNLTQTTSLAMFLVDSNSIIPPTTNGCSIGQTVCLYQATYEAEVDLPLSFSGYHIFYDRCCRTPSVINLLNPGDQGLAFHAFIAPTLINNSSPVFSDVPVPFLCVGDTVSILNTATDPDGDLLIFSFVEPYKGFGDQSNPAPLLPSALTWPIPTVNWANSTFDENNPFGALGHAFMDGATGLTEYMVPNLGNYVVAVEIREFRFGNLIGITRRDMQFMVISCPLNLAPTLSGIGGGGITEYTIQECDNLSFPIVFTDPEGDNLSLLNTGNVFNSSIVNPAATIDALVLGVSSVATTFNWQTGCGSAQALPYVFTASVTDDGCPPKTTNIVYEITVEPTSSPDSIIGAPLVCENTIETYSTDTIIGYTFIWSVTGGVIVSGQGSTSINVIWGSVGGGIVAVLGESSCGCPSTVIDTNITILLAPSAAAGFDFTICEGDSVQIGGAPTGAPGTSISWMPSVNITNSSLGNPFVFPTTITDYIVTVDNGSCLAKDTTTMFVNALPLVDAGLAQTICNAGTVTLGGSPTGPIGTTYSWTPSGTLNNVALANPFATLSATTNYVVSVTDLNVCTSYDSILITVTSPVRPTFTVDSSICIGDLMPPLPNTSANGVSGLWSPPFINNLVTTTYTFEPLLGECADTTTLTITVNSLATPLFNLIVPICEGDTTNPLPAISTNGIAGTWLPAFNNLITTTYTFTPVLGECATTTTLSIQVNPPVIPTFNQVLELCEGEFLSPLPTISLNGVTGVWSPALNNMDTTIYTFTPGTSQCASTSTLVIPIMPLPNVRAGKDLEICKGASIQLAAFGATSYSWTPTTNVINPLAPTPIVSPNVTTTYVVVGTDVNSCSNSDTVVVTVFSIPILSDTTICIGNELQLLAVGPVGASYEWFPITSLSDPLISNPITNTTNTITYQVTVVNVNGCSATESMTISAESKPFVAFLMSLEAACEGVSVEFTNLSTNARSYLWIFGDGNQSTEFSPTHVFASGVNYTTTLEVTNSNGCINTSDSIINTSNFDAQFNSIPPSVFSPNNDGINDVFQLDIPGAMAACTNLQIFNRWGSKIFESVGQNVAWDGRTTAAQKVPAGTYFYILDMNGISKRGTLTLLE